MNMIFYRYHFQNVGQGLFASGALRGDGSVRPILSWVYDCGTVSSDSLIEEGIDDLEHVLDEPERVDLVTLSHFDRDHISGMTRLISRYKVDTFVLPYVPLWKRLLIAIEEGVSATEPLMSFFIDPVAYLSGVERVAIGRFVFVLPSGLDGPPLGEQPFPRGGGRDNQGGENDPGGKLFVPIEPSPPPEVFGASGGGSPTVIEFLRNGAAIRHGMLWEFVPYNDDSADEDSERTTPPFLTQVAKLRSDLIAGPTDAVKERALKSLKRLYDKTFGKGSINRNRISLYLYSGRVSADTAGWVRPILTTFDLCDRQTLVSWDGMTVPVPSVLYTGDAYLDEPAKVDRMVSYLSDERIRRLGPFQVMHHGSEKNWYEGLPARIGAAFSIFSSDPERKDWRHPDAAVVKDFSRCCWPVFVDKRRSATFYGSFRNS